MNYTTPAPASYPSHDELEGEASTIPAGESDRLSFEEYVLFLRHREEADVAYRMSQDEARRQEATDRCESTLPAPMVMKDSDWRGM